MDVQNGLPALHVGIVHGHLPVEPARPLQGGVQDVRPVGGGDDDDPLVGGEPVHLHQKLVQRLFLLVVAAAQASAPLPAHGVDLIDEDHRGGAPFGGVEQVPDPGRAHAHEHLHEIGAGDGEEGHLGLPRHGLGHEGLAGPRRAHQQDALRYAGAHLGEPLGLLQKVHDLLQLQLLLVGPRHVLEGDGVLPRGVLPSPGPAEVGHLLAAALLPVHEPHEQGHGPEQQHVGQYHHQPALALGLDHGVGEGIVHGGHGVRVLPLHLGDEQGHVLAELLLRAGEGEVRPVGEILGGIVGPGIEAAVEAGAQRLMDGLDLVVLHQLHEVLERDLVRGLGGEAARDHVQDQGAHERPDQQGR